MAKGKRGILRHLGDLGGNCVCPEGVGEQGEGDDPGTQSSDIVEGEAAFRHQVRQHAHRTQCESIAGM